MTAVSLSATVRSTSPPSKVSEVSVVEEVTPFAALPLRQRDASPTQAETTGTLTELSRLLRERRASLPISELARWARVSPRTIVALENADALPLRISSRVVIRLATALDADVHSWLSAAGYTRVPDELITRVRARQADKQELLTPDTSSADPRVDDPTDFFARLAATSDLDTRLLTTVYAAAPRTIDRIDVRGHLVQALRSGLWLALLLPFPPAGHTRNRHAPLLSLHFDQIEARVLALRDSLLQVLPPARHGRVRVFRLADGERTGIPPAPLAARPVFLSRLDSDPATLSGHAMYTWVDTPAGDSFWHIHDDATENEPSEQAQVWHEMCREVIVAWQSGTGTTWGALPSRARWTIVDDGTR